MDAKFRREIWISAAVIGFAFLIGTAGGWWFQSDIAYQADQIAKSRTLLHDRGKLFETLAGFKKIGPEIDTYQKRLEQMLPTKDNLLDFSRQLDNLARVYNVSLNTSFSGESSASEEQFGFLSFSLEIRGSMPNIVKYFEALESQSTQFLITLTGTDVSQTNDIYRVSAQGKVFYKL